MYKIILAASIFLTAACSSNDSKRAESEAAATTDNTQTVAYACPMHCEGEKTYAQAGKCPVCKMDLQEVAMAETDSTEHNH
jgi:hypothetical protein